MYFQKPFLQILVAGLFLAQTALAISRAGYVTLINATPYDWKLSSSHSYQVEWDFPKVVKAGTSHEQFIKFKKDHHDDGAEAIYHLENSLSPASFVLKARPPKHIEVEFQGTLASLNNPENSIINLGFVESGTVSFVLSGDAGSYISSNPPVAWMQATLPKIQSKSLREIAMPASHDAGMSEVSHAWAGVSHNTQTQTHDTYYQLVKGARIFDIRPVYYKNEFYCGHFSKWKTLCVGGTGRKIRNVVKDINAFTAEYPGELIILDISHQIDATQNFRDLSPEKWKSFFDEMNKIQALWVSSSSDIADDLSSVPLSTFITPGSKSAVLVRLPDYAPLPGSGIDARSIMNRAVLAARSTAMAAHTDGMMAQGPALEGADLETSTFTSTEDTSIKSKTSILHFDQQTQNDGDGSFAQTDTSTPENGAEPMPVAIAMTAGVFGQAFIPESRLPITGSYSDTDKDDRLVADQLSKLASERPNPQAAPHKSVWTITQSSFWHIIDVANPKTSLTGLAIQAHRALLGNMWNAMIRGVSWPNMIEVDDFQDTQVTALCMAINDYFIDVKRRVVKRRRRGAEEYLNESWRDGLKEWNITAAAGR